MVLEMGDVDSSRFLDLHLWRKYWFSHVYCDAEFEVEAFGLLVWRFGAFRPSTLVRTLPDLVRFWFLMKASLSCSCWLQHRAFFFVAVLFGILDQPKP